MKSLLLLSLLVLGCANVNSKSNLAEVNRPSPGDSKLDPKFESYEGGSEAHEKVIHQKIIDFSIQMLKKNRSKYPKIPRDAHAKSHGCFRAKFIVDNKFLHPTHRVGVFKENKTYNAYVRFSNNDQLPFRKDNVPDLRGVAIKLLNANPSPNAGEVTSQDFLMYGSKKFFIKNNKDYIEFIKGLRDDRGTQAILQDQPVAAAKTIAAQTKIFHKKNPMSIAYFSATPVRLGRRDDVNRTAMKYGVYPVEPQSGAAASEASYGGFPCEKIVVENVSSRASHNYMKENLIHTLKKNMIVCFDFKLQLQKFPEVMPVEDASVEWPDSKKLVGRDRHKFSPYTKVATLVIDYRANDDLKPAKPYDMTEPCEDMSFTPWHSLPEHVPLGRTMRMRRDVYKGISDFRRTQNKVDMKEPQR